MASADEPVKTFGDALVESLELNIELIEMIVSLAPDSVRERQSFRTVVARVEKLKELRGILLGEMEGPRLQ